MPRPVRFVHVADLHLDPPFLGVSAFEDRRVKEALLSSTLEALERVVELCVGERVDFLAVAGDVFDARVGSIRARLAFERAMKRLQEHDIPVFVAHGNHDPLSPGEDVSWPGNVHRFSSSAVERRVVKDRDGEEIASVYGRSYARPETRENLAVGFRRDARDRTAIGILHTHVGAPTSRYAPSSLADLVAADMDYWALGHVHSPQRLSDSPRIAYSGCAQGLDINECGPRGCYLVQASRGSAEETFVPTASVRWERRVLDVSGAAGHAEVGAAIDEECQSVRRASEGLPAILRLELSGRTHAHAWLADPASRDELLADLRAVQMSHHPWLWVDNIVDGTNTPLDLERLALSPDLTGDVARLADELLGDPEAAEAFVAEAVAPLRGRSAEALEGSDAAETIARARELLVDALEGGEEL